MSIIDRCLRLHFPDAVAKARLGRWPAGTGIALMYHEVLPDTCDLSAWTVLRTSSFFAQMQYLAKHFDVVTIDQALLRVTGVERSPRPFAVVTFDDGYAGNLHHALPVMREFGLPFTVYVAFRQVLDGGLYWYDTVISLLMVEDPVTMEFVEEGRRFVLCLKRRLTRGRRWEHIQAFLSYLKQLSEPARLRCVAAVERAYPGLATPLKMLTPDELAQLAHDPLVTIGCHTFSHELLDQLDDASIAENLRRNTETLRDITGQAPTHFAYPNGNYDARVKACIKRAGYSSAMSTRAGLWRGESDPFEIPRYCIGRFDSLAAFKARLFAAV